MPKSICFTGHRTLRGTDSVKNSLLKLKVVHISSSDIGNIYTVLPTRNEQNNIVYQLDPKCKEIDNIKSDIQIQIL